MGKIIKRLIISAIFGVGITALSVFLVLKAVGKMGEDLEAKSKKVQQKSITDMAKIQRNAEEAEARKAREEAEIKAKNEAEFNKAELKRFDEEIAQHKAEDKKKAEFESQFKPRAECEDPNIEWSESVKCTNEKIAAKEKFYSSH